MSYETFETTDQAGAPVELYRFLRGATQEWLYTSAEVDQADPENPSDTWTSAPISRTAFEQTPERIRNNVTLTVPRDFAVADLFRQSAPTDIISLTILRFHREDSETVVVWSGRVLGVSFSGAQATMQCEPVSSSLKRTGLRRLYQMQCPHVLYGTACGVLEANHEVYATVLSISGNTITVHDLLDRPYAGGYVEWTTPEGNLERRFIKEFVDSDNVLTLNQPFYELEVGNEVRILPGCDHTMATCSGVYENLAGYGGMPFVPTKNPFDGTPVY